MNALAKDIMTAPAGAIEASTPVLEAAKRLINSRVTALPVVDPEGHLIGIVSEADLIEQTLESPGNRTVGFREPSLSLCVADVMTRQVVVTDESDTLEHVGRLLLKHRLKCLPVVADRTLKVTGVIGRVDLLRYHLSLQIADEKTVVTTARGEAEIRQAVMTTIQSMPSARPRRTDVVVKNGVAHLWGELERREDQAVCIAAVKSVSGVRDVRSHMHVLHAALARK